MRPGLSRIASAAHDPKPDAHVANTPVHRGPSEGRNRFDAGLAGATVTAVAGPTPDSVPKRAAGWRSAGRRKDRGASTRCTDRVVDPRATVPHDVDLTPPLRLAMRHDTLRAAQVPTATARFRMRMRDTGQ